jgi:hypothetical protein
MKDNGSLLTVKGKVFTLPPAQPIRTIRSEEAEASNRNGFWPPTSVGYPKNNFRWPEAKRDEPVVDESRAEKDSVRYWDEKPA